MPPDRFTDAERGTTPDERGTRIAAADPPGATAPGSSTPAAAPAPETYKAVAFVLGRAGHRRAGHPPKEVAALYNASLLFVKAQSLRLRTQFGLDYDPIEIVEFNTFAELIGKKPSKGVWRDILLVTHGGGTHEKATPDLIFLGDKELTVSASGTNEVLDQINAHAAAVGRFRKGFDPKSQLAIFACGVGSTGPDVAIYMRELFGVDGMIKYANTDIDFLKDGTLVAIVDGDDKKLRLLQQGDFSTVPSKDDIANADDRIPLP